jgi:integrase
MSEIFKRKNKGRELSPHFYFDFTVDGRRERGSTHRTNRSEALAYVRQLKARAIETRRTVAELTKRAPLLSEFAQNEFLPWVTATQEIEPATRKYYSAGWKLLSGTALASMRMDEITKHDCGMVEFPGSAANGNRALRTLRRMLSLAKEKGYLRGELVTIGLRKESERSIAMSQADAEKIASHMPDGDARDAFLVIRATGMRPSECFAMRWEFFQWELMCYRNPGGKTRSARRAVPLLGDAMGMLKRRHLFSGSPAEGWAFPADSKSGHRTTIHKAFTKARNAAGLPAKMVLYAARHGAATDLAEVASLKAVMEILGHTQTKTALRYQHPDVNGLQARLDEARTNGRVN